MVIFVVNAEVVVLYIKRKSAFFLSTCFSQKKSLFGGKLVAKIKISAFVLHHAFLPLSSALCFPAHKQRLSAKQFHWLSAARLHSTESWKS